MAEDSGPLSQAELDAMMDAIPSTDELTAGAGISEMPISDTAAPEAAYSVAAAVASEASYNSGTSEAASPLRMASFESPASYEPSGSGLQGFDRVNDIPLELTVELGRTKLLIRDILELGTGSVIELEKMAGEPVDLLANGLLIARGEVVVIEDNFGVRITEIITSTERKVITEDPMNQTAVA